MMKHKDEIINEINKIPFGKPFEARKLCFGKTFSYENTRQVISRLYKAGKILRVSSGIYVRAKEIPYLGRVLPPADEILNMITNRTGELIQPHGAVAAYELGLTTQVPLQSVFFTTGTSRMIQVGNMNIKLKHITPSQFIMPGTIICQIFLALKYLGKNHVNIRVIEKIKQKLSTNQWNMLIKNLTRMPIWMQKEFLPML